MSYYLSKQRDEDVVGAFRRYQAYLREHQHSFPRGGFALGTAQWYQDSSDHRSPHDAWLDYITISEPSAGEHHDVRSTSALIRVLGAYHDGFIEFHYPQLFRYSIEVPDASAATGTGDMTSSAFLTPVG